MVKPFVVMQEGHQVVFKIACLLRTASSSSELALGYGLVLIDTEFCIKSFRSPVKLIPWKMPDTTRCTLRPRNPISACQPCQTISDVSTRGKLSFSIRYGVKQGSKDYAGSE